MGTRFAGHRVRKADWVAFQARFHEHYLAEHYLCVLARDLAGRVAAKADPDERAGAYIKAFELLRKACNELGPREKGQPLVSLQLFDRRATWLFRILERDWFGENALGAEGADWPAQDVYYDNHSDMTPAMRRLRPLVDRVDEDITARRYLLAPVLSEDDVLTVFHDEFFRLNEAAKDGAPSSAAPVTADAEGVLRLHLGSRHALANWPDAPDPVGIHEHEHEHDGPGTIRDHPREARDYALARAIDVALEPAAAEGDSIGFVAFAQALGRVRAALPEEALADYRLLSRLGAEALEL